MYSYFGRYLGQVKPLPPVLEPVAARTPRRRKGKTIFEHGSISGGDRSVPQKTAA